MDGDHVQTIEKEAITKLTRWLSNAGNVLFALWIRLPFQVDNGGNWIILGGRSYLLWTIRMLFCILYLTVQILKQI